ncbi:MAG: glucokinase [Pseudomonadota bacterium]
MAQLARLLVGDIGGTHARFALLDENGNVIHRQQVLICNFPTFDAALTAYLETIDHSPENACFAVAGPVKADGVKFTNAPWSIQIAKVAEAFSFSSLKLINDFEAISRFSMIAKEDDLYLIKKGVRDPTAPVLTLGPGTGLGQGMAIPRQGAPFIIAAQGGHVTLPIYTPKEHNLFQDLTVMLGRPPAAEDVLSGRGLVNLSKAMAKLEGDPTKFHTPEDVTTAALEGDKTARQIIDQFCTYLGNIAGNAALITGTRGGVFLSGGILPRFPQLLKESPFEDAFTTRFDQMNEYLENIPVHLVLNQDAGVIGAGLCFTDRN